MPVGYGQLGCSGFIVSDTSGCFVSRKTQAYLQYGDAAFDYVESLLAKIFPSLTPAPQLEEPEKKSADEDVGCIKIIKVVRRVKWPYLYFWYYV